MATKTTRKASRPRPVSSASTHRVNRSTTDKRGLMDRPARCHADEVRKRLARATVLTPARSSPEIRGRAVIDGVELEKPRAIGPAGDFLAFDLQRRVPRDRAPVDPDR